MCLRVKDVSAGQSSGSAHLLPADGTDIVTLGQLLRRDLGKPGGFRVRGNLTGTPTGDYTNKLST